MKTPFDIITANVRAMSLYLVLFLSFDFAQAQGIRWEQTNGPYGGNIHCFVINGTTLFAGARGGAFRSTDNGTSWQTSGLANIFVLSLAVSGSTIFAGTQQKGVFRSTNNGASWQQMSSGLTNFHILSLAVSGKTLFAGTDVGGVFRSADNGTSWQQMSNGLMSTNVWSLTHNTRSWLSDSDVFLCRSWHQDIGEFSRPIHSQ